ncbi:MAG TPA: SIR2 family protein [Rhodothermales bacterium]|nr:SIR2 family protein [Rhodothermales bacterium]
MGSGISRAAEIPTGWEVTLDLVRKLAHLQDEDCEPDPSEWYKNKYGEEPDYSDLLDQLAHSQAERNQLLKSYFEPTDEEREQGLKLPTAAHKAVAELVAGGYIRVIITTNFDRLMELALEDVGIAPTVIASPDAVEGALPLAHSRCTVIKLHGDYLDTRIKNTLPELSEYDERVDGLLDQVFDEYGLIICGWSGDWDVALISALERCKSRRFTTYWAAYQGEVSENAARLLDLRKAQLISIQSADHFFGKVNEKVTALKEYDRPDPLSAKLAVASLKRYIAEERHRISLHDLIQEETERVVKALGEEHFPATGPITPETLLDRLSRYEAAVEILQALIIYGCYWGEKKHRYLWVQTVQRIANAITRSSGYWMDLRLYPAMLLLYSGGIASIAASRYDTRWSLLFEPTIRDLDGDFPPVKGLYTWKILAQRVQELLPGREREYTPLSNHLLEVLRNPLQDLLPDQREYESCFDTYEYLFALLYADEITEEIGEDFGFSGPLGRYSWLYFRRNRSRDSLNKRLDAEVQKYGEAWNMLIAGGFQGSLPRFEQVKEAVDKSLRTASRHW